MSSSSPIAIVGLGGLFAGAGDVRAFWRNVVDGVDALGDVPQSHWLMEDYLDRDVAAPDKTYSVRGGFVPAVRFDPSEFGIPPNLMEVTDVVQLLSLVVARDTLADTGYLDAAWYRPERTGAVFGMTGTGTLQHGLSARLQTPVLRKVLRHSGVSEADADVITGRFAKAFAPWAENSFPGLLGNIVAGRIANRFDLGGLNCTVDAACGSSLAAVHVAVSELESGRADLMLTGGCDIENTIFMYLCFASTTVLSRGDHIKPFDDGSDGTLLGEGIGMLALKRLADAERDGDRIYAVIRGIGSSSDGRYTSIYSPRVEGQMRALRRAHADAGIEPESVGLVECHGTGTPAGDRTELEALSRVLDTGPAQVASVAVGSVKSQIGHTKGAAGAAGLIKAALALHQKVLPPTINVTSPAAELAGSPLYVNTETRPWIVEPGRPTRRAGVSAFGFGGTNFHCIAEEAPATPAEVWQATYELRCWHAADVEALLAAVETIPAGVDGPIPPDHPRVALVGRADDEFAELRADLVERLRAAPQTEAFTAGQSVHFRRRAVDGRVAAVFSGQGSQYVGMGASSAMAVPAVREAFDAAALAATGEIPLGRVVFPPPAYDDAARAAQEAALRRTEAAQPALAAVSSGQFRHLRDLGFAPAGVIGHSLGELTALWAAGSLSDADLYRLAAARGAAMAAPAPTGRSGMAALPMSHDEAIELLDGHPDLRICNVNSPRQVVVGGQESAVAALLAEVRGARLVPVDMAFHTEHVEHAMDAFRDAVGAAVVAPPALPVYPNTAGAEYGEDPGANAATLVRQLREPVQFAPRIEQMYADGFRVFVELGPKQVLAGLVRNILAEHGDVVVVAAGAGPRGDDELALTGAAAALVALGLPLTGFQNNRPTPVGTTTSERMAILVNGANPTSDERLAYLSDLDRPAEPGETTVDVPSDGTPGQRILSDHLATHNEFLRGQLKIGDQLAGLLHEQARRGTADPAVTEGIAAIVRHSLALGESQMHAADTLRDLARLGGPDRPAPVHPLPTTPAPAALPPAMAEPPQSPAELAAPMAPTASPEPESNLPAVVEIVSAQTGYPADILEPGMDLESDLGVDSIKRVEIMTAVRERFPELPLLEPEQLAELRTLADIDAFIAPANLDQEVVAGPKAGEDATGISLAPVRPIPLPSPTPVTDPFTTRRAVISGACGLAQQLAEALRRAGWTVVDAFDDPVDLVVRIAAAADSVGVAVHELDAALRLASTAVAPLAAAAAGGRAAFVTVSRMDGVFGAHRGGPARAVLGGLPGLTKTLAHESPQLFCRSIDLAVPLADDVAARLILQELVDETTDLHQVGYDATQLRRTLAPCLGEALRPHDHIDAPGPSDTLLVTGGGHGITAECARALAQRHGCAIVLVGRTELTDGADWAAGLDRDELAPLIAKRLRAAGQQPTPNAIGSVLADLDAQREIRATIAAARAAGAEVSYLSLDITDADAVLTTLAPDRGRITGVVHGAGVLADRLVADTDHDAARRVLAVKVEGLGNVLGALDPERLRHVVLFSSVAGLYGNAGQAAYAMANQAMDGVAWALLRELPKAAVTSMVWGAWAGGMVRPELARRFADRGIELITMSAGVSAFLDAIGAPPSADAVRLAGPARPLMAAAPPPGPPPAVRLPVAELLADPVLADHTIGGAVVLPATAAVGAMLQLAGGTGRAARRVTDFAVLHGVVLDEKRPAELVITVTTDPSASGSAVIVRDETGRARYRATVTDDLAPVAPLTPPDSTTSPIDPYADGVLFHGPAFRGIVGIAADDESRTVFECSLPDRPITTGAYGTEGYSPVLADLLPQAAALAVARRFGRAALPTGVGQVEIHGPLPDGERFLVHVEDVIDHAPMTRCTVTACGPGGAVLLRLRGLTLVSTSGLDARLGPDR